MGTLGNGVRIGAVLLGTGSLVAGIAMPGAASTAGLGAPFASVTRAVLTQANADASEVTRTSLVTQIQVDGQGELNVNVPVAEGSAPKNMDSFGGPAVENGQAEYNLLVDGARTIRTLQAYDPAEIPVDLTVTASLDGRPISPTELTGVTGEVVLTYTAENLTGTPTELTYRDGSGKTITEDVELPTAMGGTLDIVFPPEWTEITSEDATVISGDGSGSTQFSAGYTLFPPFGEVTGAVRIKARVDNGDMPPAVLKFTVLQPEQNPTARSIAAQLGTGVETGEAIYDAGKKLGEGAGELQAGLIKATDGAQQIATGVAGTLAPGVNELNSGVRSELVPGVGLLVTELGDLPATVRSSDDFSQITDGFATLDSAVSGVRDALGVFSSTGAGQYLNADGSIDKSRTTAARTLWSLIYGVRQADVPADSPTNIPSTDTGGLTNPQCNVANPTDPANPCGAWQIINLVSNTALTQVSAGLTQIKAGVDTQLTPGVAQVSQGISGQAVPGLQQISGGLSQASAALQDTNPLGGAWAVSSLSAALGCTLATVPGQTGPIVDGTTGCLNVGAGQGLTVAALLNGITADIYNPPDLVTPANSGLAALLDPVFTTGIGDVVTGLNLAVAGLGQVSTGLSGVSSGLAQANGGVQQSQFGLNELLPVITSKSNGEPDADTAPGNTATGILSELRRSLALGGAGSSGAVGGCLGYNTPGDPSSGLNTSATSDQVRQTCAAADVLNVAVLASGALEEGVSSTLLKGISAQLVEGVQPLLAGVGALADGTQQLADGMPTLVDGTAQLAAGLPAAVDGAGQIVTDAAQPLQEQGDEAAASFARQVALYETMNVPLYVDKYIPGGAPTGDNVRYNGVYAFELAGTGSGGTKPGVSFALAALALAGAAAVGGFLARRTRG